MIRFWRLVALVALGAASVLTDSDSSAADGPPIPLRFGVSTDILMNVSLKDAQAAFEVWTKEIGREMGKSVETHAYIIEDPNAMAAAVRRNQVDLVLLPTLDYLRFKEEGLPLEASRIAVVARASLDIELLLVRRDTGIASIADLAGRRVLLRPGAVGHLSELWLDVLLLRSGHFEARRFFGEVRPVGQVGRSNQIVLPVFFRQAEAAVVREANLATISEMNPQVGRDLLPLARSPHLLHGVVCFNKQIAPEPRQILLDGLARLEQSTAGKQILTLFKTSHLIPFEPWHTDGAVEVLRERAVLVRRAG